MEEILKFLDIHYKNALKLVDGFNITKNKKWDSQIYLNELYVQVGHIFNVLYSDDNVNESKRKIDNLGDEISDVLLQLINLAHELNINMYDIKNISDFNYNDINGINVLLGQLTEVIMEENDCRFKKDRDGFNNSFDFAKDRLLKLFIITYNFALSKNLNMISEFQAMLDDANGFLKRFKKNKTNNIEYIDFYDENEKYLGYCSKDQAHRNGLWHKVFGCVIVNSKTNKVYFQLKSPNHNGNNKKPLLEITVGGHLTSGETLKNGIREIKEETGLNVSFNDLEFLSKRKINKKVKRDYIINEFQYFYYLNLNDISLKDFKHFDKSEVITFVETDINDAIKLFQNKKNNINAKILKQNKIIKTKLQISNFDEAFINDNLFLSLLSKIKANINSKLIIKKVNKLYHIVKIEKRVNPNKYFFDNGQVCDHKDYLKNNFRFTIMKVNTDINTKNYIIYLKIDYNNKSIPLLLVEEFNSNRGIAKYINELSNFISFNNVYDIIEKCYKEKVKSF